MSHTKSYLSYQELTQVIPVIYQYSTHAFNSFHTKEEIRRNIMDKFIFLTLTEKVILSHLLTVQSSFSGRLTITDETIALAVGRSKRTVQRAICSFKALFGDAFQSLYFRKQNSWKSHRNLIIDWDYILWFCDLWTQDVVNDMGVALYSTKEDIVQEKNYSYNEIIKKYRRCEIDQEVLRTSFTISRSEAASLFKVKCFMKEEDSLEQSLDNSSLEDNQRALDEDIQITPSVSIDPPLAAQITESSATCVYIATQMEDNVEPKEVLDDIITDGKYGKIDDEFDYNLKIMMGVIEPDKTYADDPFQNMVLKHSHETSQPKKEFVPDPKESFFSQFFDTIDEIPEEYQEFVRNYPDHDKLKMNGRYFMMKIHTVKKFEKPKKEPIQLKWNETKKEVKNNSYEEELAKEAERKAKQPQTKKQLRIQRIINFEQHYPDWKEICTREKCDLKTLQYRMYHNEQYEPDDTTKEFNPDCHPKYGFMSEVERNREFQSIVKYWLNLPWQLSERNQKILDKARKRADKMKITYDDWCSAIYDKFGNEGTMYVTHFAMKNAEKIVKDFILEASGMPMKLPTRRTIKQKQGRWYGKRKSLVDKIEDTRKTVMDYYEKGEE